MAPDRSSIPPNGSTNTGSRSRSATAQPLPSAPRPLGTFRSTPDTTSTGPAAASIGAIANRGKGVDNKPSSTSSAATFTPVARPVPRKLNFKAKVVARSAEVSTVKAEAFAVPTALSRSHSNGTGSVRGRGRGTIPPEATASGPFALGPSESRRLSRNAPVRFSMSNRDPAPSLATTGASGDPPAVLPRLHIAGGDIDPDSKEEKEEYSDPEDPEMGRIDISKVAGLDWMAPEALRKIARPKTQKNAAGFLKIERSDGVGSGLHTNVSISETTATENARGEDVTNDFIPVYCEGQESPDTRDRGLYFFQFPLPFPSFLPMSSQSGHNHDEATGSAPVEGGSNDHGPSASANPPAATHALKRPKTVTFAPVTKAPMPVAEAEALVLDGMIGQLDIYRSGAVKMRLGNGSVLEVTAGTQPTFLQHAVHLELNADGNNRSGKMTVIGGVNRRFVVSPDIESLLEAMETGESKESKSEAMEVS